MIWKIWKPVKGFEGRYEVSNKGQVRGLKRSSLLAPTIKANGYHSVKLYDGSKYTHKYIHRLVAEAYLDNPESKRTVNHLDGNKGNNDSDNLQWTTHSENHLHAYSTGLKEKKSSRGNTKLNDFEVSEVRLLLARGVTQKDIAEKFGVTRSCIADISSGRSWVV